MTQASPNMEQSTKSCESAGTGSLQENLRWLESTLNITYTTLCCTLNSVDSHLLIENNRHALDGWLLVPVRPAHRQEKRVASKYNTARGSSLQAKDIFGRQYETDCISCFSRSSHARPVYLTSENHLPHPFEVRQCSHTTDVELRNKVHGGSSVVNGREETRPRDSSSCSGEVVSRFKTEQGRNCVRGDGRRLSGKGHPAHEIANKSVNLGRDEFSAEADDTRTEAKDPEDDLETATL